ncbi:UDP-N-acetylmuramoyl-L-alanine--D-glutamate ligase [Nocardioides marmotae]|uniref:UDP-N-acetylmuramoyl-L-alanine--D-glutamate ligase n=1 Tax=Nocardioides marmotae TaxID=2663857 RepID=UPI0012B65775|nr:UDP-N-acetylmuramoyl-L-alanine--D-glutamate ligase [Nocardioides marmotae]MBC9733120.1 UDP-N-acetylmuramoyl-L-alanine--D-glutamate ligase [Nocardioides marmotae]MTB84234.1 UDP-N-acetylmuramoyl-L-alanine--D-glutamate ligase [Nocardioides marmotae]
MRYDELAGRAVVVWGAGREGRAALAELTARGLAPTVALTGVDDVPADLREVAVAGPAAMERLAAADVVVKSPGVPHTAPEFLRLRELGVPVTSLTDLWLCENADRVVAVTGTKGKSTTAGLVHHLLQATGVPAALVGNGGTPVTADDRSAGVAVAEVSSYQAADLTCSPRVAVVTSLYPEHLPWHGGYEQYVADKLNLVAHGPEVVVVPDVAGDLATLVATRATPGTRLVAPATLGLVVDETGLDWAGVGHVPAAHLPVRGRHNLVNLALAVAAVDVSGLLPAGGRPALLAATRTFAPLAHRLEELTGADGRTWVDDSLATAPEAVVAALETYPAAHVTLLAGGADRGLSFAPLLSYLAARDPAAPVDVVAVGPAGARLAADLPTARLAPDFATALAWARADTDAAVVLLSPGAPSFDEFASYEERSAAFRAAAARPADSPAR